MNKTIFNPIRNKTYEFYRKQTKSMLEVTLYRKLIYAE